jgi:signal transduction histidine kinase
MIPNARRGPLERLPLLARLVVALIAALAMVGAALYYGIDRFVSGQFVRLREEQTARFADDVRRLAAAELRRLSSLATLLAKDADLNHSTYYHLFLAGERRHPEAAVARISAAFDLEEVTLWDGEGRLIAAQPMPASADRRHRAAGGRQGYLVRANGTSWLVAEAPLLREGSPIALVRLARPLDRVLVAGLPTLYPSAIKIAGGATTAGATRVFLGDGGTVALDLSIPDPVGQALADVKALLAIVLIGAGALLAASLGAYLHWQLRPLRTLASAAAAVGKGDFTQQVAGGGAAEVSQLAAAFNAMTAGLARLRDMQRRLSHQEQLSALGRVAARVAHDINNPLTVICNAARLALKQLPPGHAAAKDMNRILHHGERCVRTVENLLEYGRPIRLVPMPLDLFAIAGEIGPRWGAAVHAAGEAWIEGDRLQLEPMLENLLANAREAAGPEGNVAIEGSVADGCAQLAVTDTGPGFSEAARAHLFEPFFTDKPGGTGLGLASALAICRAHGGDIEVGCGGNGRVSVRLPLAAQARPNERAVR